MNSITKRWVRGSLFFTIAVVLIAEALFLYYMVNGYQSNTRNAIQIQFNNLRWQLEVSAVSSPQTRDLQLRNVVEQFDQKTQFELMLLDANGNVLISSSGLPASSAMVAPDVQELLQSDVLEQGEYVGKNEFGEKIMAITVRTPYTSGGVVAMRLVTSMKLVDDTVAKLAAMSLVFLLVVVLASIISGVYFIRSIVMPLRKIEATAALIAQGDFETRIEDQRNDEIGSLCKTINNMAEELSKSEQMKNEFISSVSHELRTPLTSIKGWAETVGNIRDPGDPSFRRGVEIISGETERLYSMVEELLDFSRMQNGLSIVPERLDLAAEVEDVVLLTAQRAANQNVVLDFEAPELPVPILADKNRVKQVLLNILDNALKYSPEGSTVFLEILQDTANAFVTIADQGLGIAPEDLENIKLRFYKGKGATRGSGIGLAVVEEIMQAHGGGLDITSETGKGTQVVLRFPLHKLGALGQALRGAG
ncbi:HAMP domain-containing histidine kinase [Ruminococcaceae bacterium OttesenSCG-928-A16]|nr:HAMP domain-containing histidine kinase [Ruminococcaceae bacterium OttesenSCG-928-A16]